MEANCTKELKRGVFYLSHITFVHLQHFHHTGGCLFACECIDVPTFSYRLGLTPLLVDEAAPPHRIPMKRSYSAI